MMHSPCCIQHDAFAMMHLGLALPLKLRLLLLPQLLVELCALAGLVAVQLRGQRRVDLARAVLLAQLVVVLLLALRLALELVGDGTLVLYISLTHIFTKNSGVNDEG